MTVLRRWLDAALARLSTVGADPDDDEDTRLRKALLVLIAALILPISFIWAALYIGFGSWTGWFAILYAAISIASIAVFARTRDFGLLLNIQLLDILLSPTVSTIPLGGFVPGGAVGIWGILAPLGALVFIGVGAGVRWYVAFVALFLVTGIAGGLSGIAATLPAWFSNVMLVLNITVGGSMVFTMLALFARQRQDAL
ncbi:MAG: hypothetical protein ACRDF7_11145, partial [Candidatus Limnocylindrales bacterium]